MPRTRRSRLTNNPPLPFSEGSSSSASATAGDQVDHSEDVIEVDASLDELSQVLGQESEQQRRRRRRREAKMMASFINEDENDVGNRIAGTQETQPPPTNETPGSKDVLKKEMMDEELKDAATYDPEKCWNHQVPDRDNLRILVATDNHLGYLVNDPVRGQDSFQTMEEIFKLAVENKVDMMILGGDLFHLNKPCRKTMQKTLEIFRKHVFGKPGIQMQANAIKVVSDQSNSFPRDLDKKANLHNENLHIKLPVFMIHGNHDDPTRDGTDTALSAIDILQTCGLVNYFGAAEEVEHLQLAPVLIRKNKAKLALYGLGWIRDERLNRMFANGHVNFIKPVGNHNASSGWFNMFVVHQNRQNKGRGAKNCLQESFIPPFFDLAVFGHEHECRIDFEESITESFNLCQPGSSIATSLVPGEEVKKHVLLLELTCPSDTQASFRYKKLPLTSVRPFLMEETVLSGVKQLEFTAPTSKHLTENEKTELVTAHLEARVHEMINEAKHVYAEENPNLSASQVNGVLPLIRLRVEFTGYSPINVQRFGAKFTSVAANPSNLLLFYKKRKPVQRTRKQTGTGNDGLEEQLEELPVQENAGDKISALIEEILEDPNRQLKIFQDKDMNQAVDDFVTKQQSTAIRDFVSASLEDMKDFLKKGKQENCILTELDVLEKINAIRKQASSAEEAFEDPGTTFSPKDVASHQDSVASRKAKQAADGDHMEMFSDSDAETALQPSQDHFSQAALKTKHRRVGIPTKQEMLSETVFETKRHEQDYMEPEEISLLSPEQTDTNLSGSRPINGKKRSSFKSTNASVADGTAVDTMCIDIVEDSDGVEESVRPVRRKKTQAVKRRSRPSKSTKPALQVTSSSNTNASQKRGAKNSMKVSLLNGGAKRRKQKVFDAFGSVRSAKSKITLTRSMMSSDSEDSVELNVSGINNGRAKPKF